MNICFFSGDITRSGGTERVLSTLTKGLLAANDSHHYFILSLEMERNEPFFSFDERIKLENLGINGKMRPVKKMARVVRGLREFIFENEIDLLIDVDTILSMYSVPALALLKTKHLSWEHFTYQQNLGVRYRNWGRKLAGRFADGIVVLTQRDRQQYLLSGSVKRPVHHIYNPVVLDEKMTHPIEVDRKVIFSAGRLAHQKGFDLLIDVAELVFQKNPDWVWIIAGEGEDREVLEQKIEEKHLEKNLFLAGNVENIEDYYQMASLFVLTSRFEPFGLVLTEAKSYHLPCVSFDVDAGPAEIILEDVNGFLVEPYQVQEMASKINFLIEHPEIRHFQSLNAMVGTEKFLLENVTQKWEELFQSFA